MLAENLLCVIGFLKWQNENGEILEYPCNDINSTQYNSGESGDKTMTLGSATTYGHCTSNCRYYCY